MKTQSSDSDCPPLPQLVVVVGPTAVGKTALAVQLAEAVNGEIVSADSRQIYRYMDIGTAKASAEEQRRVVHHLLDVAEPEELMGLAQFQELAYATIDDIMARGRIPFLVGGTGQWILAVVEGWQVPRVPPDPLLRRRLYQQAEAGGRHALHARLRALDPEAAERIDPRNVRRVVRALEVCIRTGKPISEQQRKVPPPYRVLMLGLTLRREALYLRVDERVDRMMAEGLESEVRGLVASGYRFDLPSMSGVGYRQFAPYLDGQATVDEVIREIKQATRRFARQQSNWFRLDDPRINWFDASEPATCENALAVVRDFLHV